MFEKERKNQKHESFDSSNKQADLLPNITITIMFEALCLLVVGVLGIVKPCCASLQ